jgi:NAD(P)-dependent dehydrogenase (short-subunit alcohol dehydrogenase family)
VSYLESLFSLRAKNALITGAASGLGRLAQAGARIALVDVNQAGLAETAAPIGQAVALPPTSLDPTRWGAC